MPSREPDGQLRRVSRFIEEKRAKVDFAPNNRKGVEQFLQDVGWEKTPLGKDGKLGKLLALPEKGKPITSYSPQAKGWKIVADGLATVFARLIEEHRARG